MEPLGPDWIVTENQLCQVHNPHPEPGETVTWSGGCVDGTAHGEGRLVWWRIGGTNRYVGEMRGGKRHGQGTYIAGNGALYEGEWHDSNRHGQGIMTWANGDRYEGEWRDGKPHSQGTMTWTSGTHYEGEFHRGKRHGNGICAWVNGDRYEGEWRYGERHSQGTYTWPGGDRYEGEWRDGKPHSQGTEIQANGDHDEGTWLSGISARDGTDIMTLPDGDRLEDAIEATETTVEFQRHHEGVRHAELTPSPRPQLGEGTEATTEALIRDAEDEVRREAEEAAPPPWYRPRPEEDTDGA